MKEIQPQGKHFLRLFNPNYRTKEEIFKAYETEKNTNENIRNSFNKLEEKIEQLNEEKTQLTTELNQKILTQEKTKEYQKLEQILQETKKEYEKVNLKLEQKTEALENYKVKNVSLHLIIEDMKDPLNFDSLKSLTSQIADKNYKQIKEELLDFVAKSQIKHSVYEHEEEQKKLKTFVTELKELGLMTPIQNHSFTILPVEVCLNFYENKLHQINIDFDNSKNYEKELHHGLFTAKFKDKEITNNKEIEVKMYVSPDNQFFEQLRKDSKDFAKAAMWGYTSNLIEQKKYELAATLIKNNKLQDFAIPFIEKNKENKELLVYMKPVIDSYK